MLFDITDAAKIETNMEYMYEIIEAISDKPLEQKRDILIEMLKEVRTFRDAMTLLSAIIDNGADFLYKESFEVALKWARNPTDSLELYYLVYQNNFNEGKMALNSFNEMLELEMKSTEPRGLKTKIFGSVILQMEKDDELVEKNFPVLMNMAVGITDFGTWHLIYNCAVKHEYGQEAIEIVEKMWGWDLKQRELSEKIILCACLTLFDIRRTDQLLCEIKEEVERTCKDDAGEMIIKWIKVIDASPAGSRMELYSVKNVAAAINIFDDFNKAKGAAKSGKARRILAMRGLELAASATELKSVALYAKENPGIFGSALEKIKALPDSITKYYAIYGLGKEWKEFAYEKMKEIKPLDAKEQEILVYLGEKQKKLILKMEI